MAGREDPGIAYKILVLVNINWAPIGFIDM